MAHTVALVMAGKGAKPRLTDFLLKWKKPRQSGAEQLGLFQALAARQRKPHGNDR